MHAQQMLALTVSRLDYCNAVLATAFMIILCLGM